MPPNRSKPGPNAKREKPGRIERGSGHRARARHPLPRRAAFLSRAWIPQAGAISVAGPTTIWGFSSRSGYPEDRELEDAAFVERNLFPAECFSPLAPSGEYGFVPLDQVTEVTREAFLVAAERGFTNPA